MAELLLELLSEGIPARMQARAAEDLKRLVGEGLAAAGIAFSEARAFVTPRRLTVVVEGDAGATKGLQHRIKARIGISADVRIGAVERSIGKAKRVIDKRPK